MATNTNKVGTLIKEARAKAGLSQEKLAGLIDGLSASDVGKAERGEKDLTQDQLKAIAKATGVTQKSLLEAAAEKTTGSTSGKTTGKTTSSSTSGKTTGKTTSSTAGKTTGKTASSSTSGKTTSSSSSGKTTSSSSSGTSIKVTATEKKLVELYREADSATKKKVMSILKGEPVDGSDLLSSLLSGVLGQK